MTSNGTDPNAPSEESPLAALRQRPANPHGLGGFGPLIALGVLVVLLVLLAPTVAPEEIVLKPTDEAPAVTSTSVESTTTTTAAGATSSTTVAP